MAPGSTIAGTAVMNDVQAYLSLHASAYCQVSASALIFYEHLITFSDEVDLVWRYRFTSGTALFMMNRLCLLVQGIFNILEIAGWTTPLSCEILLVFQYVVKLSFFVVGAVFTSLCVYAISGKRRCLAVIALVFGLAPVGTNLYAQVRRLSAHVPSTGIIPVCAASRLVPQSDIIKVMVPTHLSAMVMEIIVIATSWFYLFPWRATQRSRDTTTPLVTMLLRNGSLSFLYDTVMILGCSGADSPLKVL
ncbi:hypothetical protein WOLCODRAFT_24980 [Wolfiporia cocos MD-104 SS10]|uniref:DUF6533 domain-containing protein n=1 Tax=Wolfiporia cocos (strain MD-104) TaxID=742152 RepID=A0A2H3JVF0_WOLCO|nr:hypothetical protein WOLCODRAFT_24980 [Wolfiporia cocos MD-104 SS10]